MMVESTELIKDFKKFLSDKDTMVDKATNMGIEACIKVVHIHENMEGNAIAQEKGE